MSAYVLSLVTPVNTDQFATYREIAQQSMETYGGHYIIRGAPLEVAEGVWPLGQLTVIMEFPDMATLHAWYNSPEYAPARAMSNAALKRQLVFIEGANVSNTESSY